MNAYPLRTATNAPAAATATASFSSGGVNADLMLFAKSMEARVQTLQVEVDQLQQAETIYAQQEARLQAASAQNASIRSEYLQAIRNRHGVELELSKVQEQQRQCQESIAKLLQETRVIQQETDDVQAEHGPAAVLQSLFAEHYCHQELYTKLVQGQIGAHEQHTARRARQLERLTGMQQDMEREQDWYSQQETQLTQDMERSLANETDENQVVQDLAVQVRSSLTKVCTFCVCVWVVLQSVISYY